MGLVVLFAVWLAALRVAVYVTLWVIVGLLAIVVSIVRGLIALSTRSRGYGG